MVYISLKRIGYLCIIGVFLLISFINGSSFVTADVGYDYLDGGTVFHMWNNEDEYFFNRTSGMQITNHYDDYWSKNVFCGGWYDGDDWNVLACIDELPFTWSIDTDDSTYINVTGYRDVTYLGRDVRFALRYHLKPYDTRLSIEPYMKNIGTLDIPLDMGFAWHIRDINIDDDIYDNTIEVYSENVNYSLANNFEETWVNTDGSLFITNEKSGEHIFMSWDSEIAHAVQVKPVGGQYNSPVSLGLKIGTLAVGQEKTTTIKWIDADPNCDNVGTDGNEDICFVNSATASSYTNYSDADFTPLPGSPSIQNQRFPRFKITNGGVMPFGCTYTCRLYRQSVLGGDWTEFFTASGAGCYNVWASRPGKCNTGYCLMEHTEDEDDRTQWDLCIFYSGGGCSEDGNVYCGLGSQGGSPSNYGDKRVNISYNQNTPLDYNVTLINWTNATGTYANVSFNTLMGTDLDGRFKSLVNWYYDEVYSGNENITYTTGRTTQEDANDTASTGAWAAFLPFANVIDGNWAGTPGGCFPPNTAYGYINYTKINNSYAVEWEVKDNCDRVNLSIPHECFNAYEDTVAFKIFSDGANGDAYWYCWNSTDWYDVRSSCRTSQVFWEEQVHWKTEVQDNTITLDVTDLCLENITFEVQTWDDSYFSPTDNQTWVWSDTIYSCLEDADEGYIFAIIASFILGGLVLLFYAAKLDDEHKPIKLLLRTSALLIFLAGISVADLLIETDISGFYSAFTYMVYVTIAITIILYLKEVVNKIIKNKLSQKNE